MEFSYPYAIAAKDVAIRYKGKEESLSIFQLADIEKTIDELFEYYSAQGKAELLDELCPYFGIPWPSALALSEWLLEESQSWPNTATCLELGAGLALPSLFLARHGFRPVLIDHHPDFPVFLEKNCAENKISKLNAYVSDWKKYAPQEQPWQREAWDIIFASDVLYDKEQPRSLSEFLTKIARPNTIVYIADPDRPYFPSCMEMLKKSGWKSEKKMAGKIHLVKLWRNI